MATTPSAPAKSPSKEFKGFGDSEVRMMALVLQQIFDGDHKPTVDYEKLGATGGWTTGSASVIFGNLRRKLQKAFDEGRLASQKAYKPTDMATFTPVKKRGRPAKDITPSSTDGFTIDTPSKKRRTLLPKSSPLAPAADDGDALVSSPGDLDDSEIMADAEVKEKAKLHPLGADI